MPPSPVKENDKKRSYLRIEFKGRTSFSAEKNSPKKIDVFIAAGYRSKTVKGKTERYAFASLTACNKKGVTLKDIIEACGGDPKQVNIPTFLKEDLALKSFSITYGSDPKSSSFTIGFRTKIKINGHDIDTTIFIATKVESNKRSFEFSGLLKLDKTHLFDIKFIKSADDWSLFASYRHKGKAKIELKPICLKLFGKRTADKMPDVSFTLKNFKACILYKKVEGKSNVLFAMGAGLKLDLRKLPMAGPIVVRENSMRFEEVLVMYAKGKFTKEELKNYPLLPQADIGEGFNISTSIVINNETNYYLLNSDVEKEEEEKEIEEVTPVEGEVSSKAKWIKVNKKLGPVYLQRLGFTYYKGKVVMLIDGAVAVSGFRLDVIGLGVGFKLQWPPKHPEFYIDGLGLSYIKDPVRISGMLARVAPKKPPQVKPEEEELFSYYGAAQIAFSRFNISGVGAYSKLKKSGAVSFFIYAVYQGNIGGPAFFFVTGIAAGFGYNRRVRIPKIEDVSTFPLVAMALNPKPNQSLNEILAELIAKDCIPTAPGDYWLAVGIKFTSFKIIESFVLLIVQFGTRVEVTILGLSILAWPDKENPIAYIELALKATFGSDSDFISVEALLTRNSYVLDKNCKLTGGFAFYAWVKGPHEGDFVITLGGYHPQFKKPKHYPDVPRLGLNWRISSELQIKGGLYYALTPSCIMAGGKLEITYTLSFLRGSIVVWADMLIGWAPFRYRIDMGICIRIEANIDMGLFTVRFNIEMGCQLHIWGPPFAGEVFVDWCIFSFTIPFGPGKDVQPKNLEWKDFKKQFIPAKEKKALLKSTSNAGDDKIYNAAEITIADGIINELEIKGEKYVIVNPHKLSIRVEAPVPVITAKIQGGEIGGGTAMLVDNKAFTVDNKPITYANRNTALGIRPMGRKDLSSTLDVMLTGVGLKYDTYACSVPEALWSPEPGKKNSNTPDDAKVLPNALKGMVLRPEKVGIPQGTPQFDLSGKFSEISKTLTWKYIAARTGPSNAAYEVSDLRVEIRKLVKEKKGADRSGIINAALKAQGVTGAVADDNIEQWVSHLISEPVIVQVGGLPQYKPETGK